MLYYPALKTTVLTHTCKVWNTGFMSEQADHHKKPKHIIILQWLLLCISIFFFVVIYYFMAMPNNKYNLYDILFSGFYNAMPILLISITVCLFKNTKQSLFISRLLALIFTFDIIFYLQFYFFGYILGFFNATMWDEFVNLIGNKYPQLVDFASQNPSQFLMMLSTHILIGAIAVFGLPLLLLYLFYNTTQNN